MKLKSKKSALLLSFTSLLLCFAMLAGSTFAWFTDTATTGVNKIVSGNLKVDIVGKENTDHLDKLKFTKAGATADAEAEILWEPGCRYLTEGFRIANKGNLALKWKAQVNKGTTAANEKNADLLDVIDFYLVKDDINETGTPLGEFTGTLEAKKTSENVYYIKGVMKTTAGNDYQGLELDGITITVYATQDTVENDSYGPTYDKNATYYPVLDAAGLKDALVNGGNIKVDSSFDAGNDALAVNKDTVLDMNGKTISNTADIWDESKADWSLISARNGAKLTITGNGTFKAKENDSFTVDVQDGATVTIEDGTFIGNIHAVYVYEGTANIKGGFYAVQQKYTDANKADGFVLNCYDANRTNGTAKIIVTGGTFVNFNPADCWAEGEHTNFVADGYSVISEQHGADTWYTVVKGQGATAGTQGALNNAIQNNPSPTVKLTAAGTYTLPEMSGKDVTIVGTKDTVIDMKGEDGTGVVNKAASASFEGVTVMFGTGDYKGFQHTGKLTYKDCTITGKQFLYANEVEFINCKFVQDAVDYNVWTYGAGKVLFKDCEFECEGKAVLIYNEGSINGQTVEFQNCKFKASAPVTGKAAIEIDSSLLQGDAIYKVIIDQSTANNVTGFDAGSVSGNPVWNNKKGEKATVIVNGETVLAAK